VTKILSLEITIFGLKMMLKGCLEKNILKFLIPLQRYLLSLSGQIFPAATLKGAMEFQNIFF